MERALGGGRKYTHLREVCRFSMCIRVKMLKNIILGHFGCAAVALAEDDFAGQRVNHEVILPPQDFFNIIKYN